MASSRLSVKGLAIASAVLWGGAVLFVAFFNLRWQGYGQAFLDVLNSVYPVPDDASPIKNVVMLTVFAFFDGIIGGAIFACIYNFFTRSQGQHLQLKNTA